ncbi:hypothetical protein IFM51744_05860 [Aspergillus udagawae]|nr:hypothetical protein IFM51744_05860 [Aspergillus udagawae]
MAAAILGYERHDGVFFTVPNVQFGAPTDPRLHFTLWYDWNEECTGYAMPDISTTDSPPGKEELKAPEIFQNAIQRALASIRSNDFNDALLAMQGIEGNVLLEMQEGFLPDAGSIEDQNQKRLCVEDTFWHQFNICWLAFGQRILDFHRNLNSPPDRLIQLIQLVDSASSYVITIGDKLEKWGLVDYEMGIWEEEILSIFSRCQEALEKTNRVEMCSPGNLGTL